MHREGARLGLDNVRNVAAFCSPNVDLAELKATLLDYISPTSNRWTAQRKVAALMLVRARLLGAEDFCRAYGVSMGELTSWARSFDERGIEGLMATKVRPKQSARRARAGL